MILALDPITGKPINARDLPRRQRAALEGRLREHKYGARKKEVDGILFDSTREARQYQELALLLKCGVIAALERQVEFVLQEAYVTADGRHVKPIVMRVDFVVTNLDGSQEVVEPKGFRTEGYRIKRKLFEKRYPEYGFREV